MSAIEVKNLKKYFGQTKAVDDISFTVEKGEIFGFLGPNGAGKTTTIRCMMDFIRPDEGSVSILGEDAQKDTVALKKKIGYLAGGSHLYNKWTGQEHIDFVRGLNGKNDIAEELAKRLDFNPKLKAKNLSSGNKQKLSVILALMFQPELLILDEPTLGLDPLLQNVIYELLEEATKRGATVFMSSHNLAEVDRICHRIGIIKQGKMVAIESIQSMKDKKMHEVYVRFAGHFNKNDFAADGMQIIHESAESITFNVKGDINPVIKKLSAYQLKDIHITQASLEEIFLEFYEKD